MSNFIFVIILFVEFLLLCAGEVINWKSDFSEFRPSDGVCILTGGKTLIPKNVPTPEEGFCGDKLYSLLKYCAQQTFYEPNGSNRPRHEFSESALYLINGCLECPYGKAEATIRLHNHLQSGSLFSRCGTEDKIVSSVSVKLNSEKNAYGSFSLGGILQGRKCNGLFGSTRETIFEKIVLEVKHNCGQRKPMTLFVLLPPVDLIELSKRNNFREWNGIRVDLGIFGVGWNERWLDFGDVFHSVPKATRLTESQVLSTNSNIVQIHEKSPVSVLPTPVEFIDESEKSNNGQKDKNNNLFEFNSTLIFACVLAPLLLGFSLSFFNYLFRSVFFKSSNKTENDYELGGGAPSITSSTLSQGTTHSSISSRP